MSDPRGAASRVFAGAAQRLTTPPRPRDLAETAVLAGVFALAALMLQLAGADLAGGGPSPQADPAGFLLRAAVALVIPALGEEVVFRGLLQPARLDGARALAVSGLSLAAFTAWHPLQLALGLPHARAAFADPAFLALAALLGLLCTISVHRSGSLLPAVLLHWAVVVAALALG